MNKVVKLVPASASLIDEVTNIDEAELQRAAMAVFEEMTEGGCSLRDCILAVYVAGMDRITGMATPKRTKKKSVPPCPYPEIVALYHAKLEGLPKVVLMNADRKKALRAFWVWLFESKKGDGTVRATTEQEALAWIGMYFDRACANDFLMGRTKRSAEHQGWRPDIDYVVSLRGMKQIIEKTETS